MPRLNLKYMDERRAKVGCDVFLLAGIADRLVEERTKRGFTRSDMNAFLQVNDRNFCGRIEEGISGISATMLIYLAKVFDWDLNDFKIYVEVKDDEKTIALDNGSPPSSDGG